MELSDSASETTVVMDENDFKKEPTQTALGPYRILVAYFSRTGNTQELAEMIHDKVHGDLYQIQVQSPYPDDYESLTALVKDELAKEARPALTDMIPGMEDYDIVFLGYPIWWGDTPMAMMTFLESYPFAGKAVIPFCTSSSDTPDVSFARIKEALPDADVLNGFWVRGSDVANAQAEVSAWLSTLNLGLS